jgi:hypothetical protein
MDTDPCQAKGSWDPLDPRTADYGRVGATALLQTSLEVYYRYDRVLGTEAASPPDAAASVRDSEEIRDLQEDLSATTGEGADGFDRLRARVRRVDGKTFLRRPGGLWVDTAWDGTGEPERLEAYSEPWFRLAATSALARRYLAVGDRVLFLHAGKVYETAPAPAPAPAPAR